MSNFLDSWIEPKKPTTKNVPSNVSVLVEKAGARSVVSDALQQAVRDHFIGLDIIARMGGLEKALTTLRESLPASKRVRSGDMGELLATEYVAQKTSFAVPIKRLRWKDDRTVTMRGDDIVAIRLSPLPPTILKVESKSKARLQPQTVVEAVGQLDKFAGRPNPCSLAFTSKRLRERKTASDDATAEFIEKVQDDKIPGLRVEHLVFTFSGNDSESSLTAHANGGTLPRRMVGLVVADHQDFIKNVFDTAHG